ncbi:hypothetical protein PCH_Pc20g02690 [Penicillium rubens Wisconsin 54-1255]|uniref:Uncharacterized protein n=1 Tax=Penicillium rubens (strain ATCC 28089 / DSM 1075 / NRRL 1951 / Wisconsin 54-1255) TaxID=500485 RepID=B6HES4_PENRW|nr:hypothetical protein PCH_Pc20g02690 [Penicillium rubens Wisconsin 54-1255]
MGVGHTGLACHANHYNIQHTEYSYFPGTSCQGKGLAFPTRNDRVEQKWGGFPSRAGTFFFKENSQRDASVRVKGGIKVGTKLPFEQDSFSFDPQRAHITRLQVEGQAFTLNSLSTLITVYQQNIPGGFGRPPDPQPLLLSTTKYSTDIYRLSVTLTLRRGFEAYYKIEASEIEAYNLMEIPL